MYEIIMSELQVKSVVERLASEVAADCAGRPLVVAGILKACVHFMSDLLRALSERGVEAEIDFIECSSYSGTESVGKVENFLLPQLDCRGKYVLLVDTILETGRTLKKAMEVRRVWMQALSGRIGKEELEAKGIRFMSVKE